MNSKIIVSILYFITFGKLYSVDNAQPVLLYGDRHVFVYKVPINWEKDCSYKPKVQCIFYRDSVNDKLTYIYSMGYDHISSESSYESFIQDDINSFKIKYPNIIIKEMKIINTKLFNNPYLTDSVRVFVFTNYEDRYLEYVAYIEGKLSTFVIVASVKSKSLDDELFDVFSKALNSFVLLETDYNRFKEKYGKQLGL